MRAFSALAVEEEAEGVAISIPSESGLDSIVGACEDKSSDMVSPVWTPLKPGHRQAKSAMTGRGLHTRHRSAIGDGGRVAFEGQTFNKWADGSLDSSLDR